MQRDRVCRSRSLHRNAWRARQCCGAPGLSGVSHGVNLRAASRPMPESTSQPVPSERVVPEPSAPAPTDASVRPREIGGRQGPEPTRYGDWEKNGRCIDF
ncbi:DUF1674 domain-containing protein [Tahibacter sp. UC22_41]|uniref:DUF1674 domain-containing protein n=1 Tax=Tahibacter sp. UC22_41 TaxID=3350178 RepID=UPI0036D9C6E7